MNEEHGIPIHYNQTGFRYLLRYRAPGGNHKLIISESLESQEKSFIASVEKINDIEIKEIITAEIHSPCDFSQKCYKKKIKEKSIKDLFFDISFEFAKSITKENVKIEDMIPLGMKISDEFKKISKSIQSKNEYDIIEAMCDYDIIIPDNISKEEFYDLAFEEKPHLKNKKVAYNSEIIENKKRVSRFAYIDLYSGVWFSDFCENFAESEYLLNEYILFFFSKISDQSEEIKINLNLKKENLKNIISISKKLETKSRHECIENKRRKQYLIDIPQKVHEKIKGRR